MCTHPTPEHTALPGRTLTTTPCDPGYGWCKPGCHGHFAVYAQTILGHGATPDDALAAVSAQSEKARRYVYEGEHLPEAAELLAGLWALAWGEEHPGVHQNDAAGHLELALVSAGCSDVRWYDGLVCWRTADGEAGHLQLTRTASHE